MRKFEIGCDKAVVVQSEVCKVQNLQCPAPSPMRKSRKTSERALCDVDWSLPRLRAGGERETKCRLYLLCRHCEHCVRFIVTALYWYALSIMGVVYIIHHEMHCTYVEVRKGAS